MHTKQANELETVEEGDETTTASRPSTGVRSGIASPENGQTSEGGSKARGANKEDDAMWEGVDEGVCMCGVCVCMYVCSVCVCGWMACKEAYVPCILYVCVLWSMGGSQS
jgi:hypothetical protein